jgi:hypothetical protein
MLLVQVFQVQVLETEEVHPLQINMPMLNNKLWEV